MSKLRSVFRGIIEKIDDKLYADAVRESAIRRGIKGKDLKSLVEEAVLLRRETKHHWPS